MRQMTALLKPISDNYFEYRQWRGVWETHRTGNGGT